MINTPDLQVWASQVPPGRPRGSLAFRVMLVIVLAAAAVQRARAQADASGYRVLYSFTGGTDGAVPAGLLRDAAGNLYGVTEFGGDLNCLPPYGCGTVFKMDKAGKETVLHSFTMADGAFPLGTLIRDPLGNLYGTTSDSGPSGQGTVFKLDKGGNERVLYSFSGGADGGGPEAGVIRDATGNLYGTTAGGGNNNNDGVVFKVDETGHETVLHTFDGTDGGGPEAPLVRDAGGNLYGTTVFGGAYDWGTVFKLDKAGNESVLHSFTGGTDGRDPYAPLVRDAAGHLYGTTWEGGDDSCNGGLGCGVVFKLDSTGNETVLYTFTGKADGKQPGQLLRDAAWNFYGGTSAGGSNSGQGCETDGCGTVFKLARNGKLTVLHTFDGTDGSGPGGLVSDGKGRFYDTTGAGGTYDQGVVFEITLRNERGDQQH